MSRTLCLLAIVGIISRVYAQKSQTLDPFSSVVACGNVPVGIKPSADNTYSVEFQGDSSQFSSLQVKVKNGVAYAQNPGSINTNSGVAIIISAPKDALQSVETNGNGYTSMVSGFTADEFQLVDSGNGATNVEVDVNGKLTVDYSGNGALTVTGSSGSLDLQNSGNGAVSVFGVQGDVSADISGNGATYIGGGPKTAISGSKTGYGAVSYTGESCDLSSSFSFGPTCTKASGGRSAPQITLPSSVGSIMATAATCA